MAWAGTGAFQHPASAEDLTFQSGPARASLVELYTSEGCSSCPPADDWLRELRGSPRLWKEFVPVAFHVDYWDQLGWPDKLASSEFSRRQRAYGNAWRSPTIYTPGFVLDGAEWRSWRGQGPPAPSGRPAGVLQARQISSGRFEVSFTPAAADAQGYEVHAALLGCGLVSEVQRGENGGRRLQHEFAALSLTGAPLEKGGSGLRAEVSLQGKSPVPAQTLAAAFWVTRRGALEPVQATGGYLP